MGSKSSTVRSAEFQHPTPPEETQEEPREHHISISNKMVERLVEDATLAVVPPTPPPVHKPDHKEKLYIDKLKSLDETHSERTGLTFQDMRMLANRIDMRTANLPSVEPVCAHCRQKVIECYNNTDPELNHICWDTITEFRKCVQEEAMSRLRERSARDARELARLTRHVARARDQHLRDLSVANDTTPV